MATPNSLALRWIKRYKIFFLAGVLIISLQIFLAYKSLAIKELNALSEIFNDDGNRLSTFENGESGKELVNTSLVNTGVLQFGIPVVFHSDCDIICKEAISALKRAKTIECRQLIANTVCAIASTQFYPKQLPNFCPAGNYTKNKLLGCYRDEKKQRLLTGHFSNFKKTNTPTICGDLCLQSGFIFYGVQYSSECFCGDDPPSENDKLPDTNCNMKCSGDSKQICGGYLAMNIFETGITKFTPQTPFAHHKKNEEPVKIAFLLTLNGRALRQVHRLIKALYAPNHIFYIHVDARQDYLFRNLLQLEKKFSNIRLSRKRFSTIWGGASLLSMLLACMEDLLDSKSWEWDFVINLSESDFPVKTVDRLVSFLTANKGRNFVKSHGRETQRFIQKQGLDKTFVECDTHMWRVGDRKLPTGIQIDGGSDWIGLSKNFVQYIINNKEKDDLLKGLLVIFRHSLLPAESFFHTVLRNSIYCNTYVDNNLHVTNWKRKLGCKCQYKHVVDWCGCSPNVFKATDWNRLKESRNKYIFFARKFEPVINQKIILQLEEWVYGPYTEEYVNLPAYWQSFYNSDDPYSKESDIIATIGESLIRLLSKRLSLEENRLLEMSHYFYQDKYKGFLIRFEANKDNNSFELEARIKPVQYVKIAKNSKFAKRLKNFEISSDFDQKEQVARNFAKILGPFSEPILSFSFLGAQHNIETGSHSYNLTLLWIDPQGKIQHFIEMHVEDSQNDAINFSKAILKQPITPGIWTVKLIGRNSIYAQTNFLISPLAKSKRLPLTKEKALALNSGSNLDLPENFTIPAEWQPFLPKVDASNYRKEFKLKAQLFGDELNKWVDNLVSKFYHLREICQVKAMKIYEISTTDVNNLPICSDTTWSTLAPDPKSDMNTLLK